MTKQELFGKYLLNTYSRVGPVFVRGKGSWLWDKRDQKFLDLFPGWGVSILGHAHPGIVKVIGEQAQKLIHLPNNLYIEEQVSLAKEIVRDSFPSKIFFANSGAEAVEGAIKLSRLYGRRSCYEIVVMKNSFHGRTFGALSATGQKKYKEPFKPLLPSFKEASFGSITDCKRKVSKKTVGVMLELIQGEGGVNVARKEYVKALAAYCKKHDLLLIVDEVQTGMGRTGKLFCFQHYGITPDVMLLSKGLGAGLPISAIVVNDRITDIIKPGMHASTFGGSPLVGRVSKEVFQIIKREKLLENANNMGKYLLARLNDYGEEFSLIRDVRGMGLMVGIELRCEAQPLFLDALKRGLVINATHGNVLRIMPALTVSRQEIDKGLHILGEVLHQHQKSRGGKR